MRSLGRLLISTSIAITALSIFGLQSPAAEVPALNKAQIEQVGRALDGAHVARRPTQSRGAGDLYRSRVRMVPLVVVVGGTGSGVVIIAKGSEAYVITNFHVAEHSFKDRAGNPFVFLLFYDPALNDEVFNYSSFVGCMQQPTSTPWCQAVLHSGRVAEVVAVDRDRDLALLHLSNAPAGLVGIPATKSIGVGDPVAVIGNPKGLLWTYTTGIVSAIRNHVQLGNGFGTVIQTDAALNPGNSGGALFALDGYLAGVPFEVESEQLGQVGDKAIVGQSPGLNFAIGINEVLAFTRAHLRG
jgi:S1-C subfamily serine protease